MKNTPHPKWTGEDPQDSGVRKELREGEGVKDNWTLGWVAGCGTLTFSGRHRRQGGGVKGSIEFGFGRVVGFVGYLWNP